MVEHVAYVDSTALVKLVVLEAESDALSAEIAGCTLASSAMARVEVIRAVGILTAGDPAAATEAERLLASISLAAVSDGVLDRAARLASATLRPLDAIHVASALTVGAWTMVTYDRRLASAARAVGLRVLAPT